MCFFSPRLDFGKETITCYIELSDSDNTNNSPDLQLLSVRFSSTPLLIPSWSSITSLDCIERVSSLRFAFLLPASSDYDFLTPFLPSPSDTSLCLRVAIASHDDFARVRSYINALPSHLLPKTHPSAARPEVSLSQTVRGCKSSVVALASASDSAEPARSSTVILPERQADSPVVVPATQETPTRSLSLPTTPVAARKRSQDALGSLHSTPQRPEKRDGVVDSMENGVEKTMENVAKDSMENVAKDSMENVTRELMANTIKESTVDTIKESMTNPTKNISTKTTKTLTTNQPVQPNDSTTQPKTTTPKRSVDPSPHTPKRRAEAATVSSQLAALSRRRPGGFLSQLAEEMAETGARRAETKRATAPRGEKQRKSSGKEAVREEKKEKAVEREGKKAESLVTKSVEKPVTQFNNPPINQSTSSQSNQSNTKPLASQLTNPLVTKQSINQSTTTKPTNPPPTTKQPTKRRPARKPIQREPEPQDFSEDESKPLITTKPRTAKRTAPAAAQVAGRKKTRLTTHTTTERKESPTDSSEAESEASVEISQLMSKLKSVLATPQVKGVPPSADTSPQSNGSESDDDLEDPSILAVQQALTSRRPTHITYSAPASAEEGEAEADPAGPAAARGDRAGRHRQTARRHGGSATDGREDRAGRERATDAESEERDAEFAEPPRNVREGVRRTDGNHSASREETKRTGKRNRSGGRLTDNRREIQTGGREDSGARNERVQEEGSDDSETQRDEEAERNPSGDADPN